MKSHDSAVCGSRGDAKGLLLDGKCILEEAFCIAMDVGGRSGLEARVVPDHDEGTGEFGTGCGKGSH